jgi:putative ABC transport system substrate-binding protein
MIFRRILLAVAFALIQTGAFAQPAKIYRVGLVSVGAPDTGVLGASMARSFTQRGYVVEGNIFFERRAAHGNPDRLPGFIDELVAKHVDLIITQSYPAAIAAKERAGNTPIVVTFSGDPVATGLAASLAHPGGNITGSRRSLLSFRPSVWRCCARPYRACAGWRFCGTPMTLA